MNHTLLPQRLQAQLMAAAATKSLAAIDAAANDVRRQAPSKFHTEESLKSRVFFNEPTGRYSGTFIRAKNDAAQ
jgi:hypothetical protein